ncbi:MAG: histidine phosphatase family protein [Rubrivivax sp.]|jgi:phosphohistidine phosphatase SixA
MDKRSALKVLSAGGAWALSPKLHASPQAEALIRQGGVVVVFRHANAPGTFDPPGFRLEDCSTQRNLGPQGREQARQIGQWFAQRGLKPQTVRSSPWCRCQDTARLAFGTAEVWPALGSTVGVSPDEIALRARQWRQALQAASRRRPGFEVWVTHQFVMSAMADRSAASGEGWVIGPGPDGAAQIMATLPASQT